VVSHSLEVSFAADSDHTGKVVSVSVAVETIATSCNSVDIIAPFFRDLLADSPVQGADAIRSLAEWSGGSAGSGGSAKTATGSTSWDREAEKWPFKYLCL
jgi:phage baseplate assembly protein gpV